VMRTLTLIKIRKHICSSVKSPTRTIEEELGKVPQPEKVIKEIRIKKPFGRPKKTPKQIEEERYQKEQEMIAMQELVEKENKRKKLKAELAALEDNVAWGLNALCRLFKSQLF